MFANSHQNRKMQKLIPCKHFQLYGIGTAASLVYSPTGTMKMTPQIVANTEKISIPQKGRQFH